VKELEAVLIAFREGTHCEAAVWGSGDGRSPPTVIARSSSKVQMPDVLPDEPGQSVPTNFGTQIVTRVPSVKKIWLTVGPCDPSYSPEDRHVKLLMPVVSQFTKAALEVEHAATELAERYEEINLLYTIGEILGRTVTLEDAAATILTEISETVGARVASILVHDARTNTLQAVAALGVPKAEIPPINADDQSSVSARVFRTQHPLIVVGKGVTFGKESPYGRGEMLSVPIMWTTPSGGMPLGVVNLADRRSRQPFTAGDQKLVTAIATQIGTAIQNARLVSASLDQQRLLQEMSLAHDLQMKLLPSTDVVAPEAEATARVIPAESVGGDFYQLFKLRDATATGVMIGDVSGHGYRAALIMALSMSASAIHAQNFINPGEMLGALLRSLREELETTEMFISSCVRDQPGGDSHPTLRRKSSARDAGRNSADGFAELGAGKGSSDSVHRRNQRCAQRQRRATRRGARPRADQGEPRQFHQGDCRQSVQDARGPHPRRPQQRRPDARSSEELRVARAPREGGGKTGKREAGRGGKREAGRGEDEGRKRARRPPVLKKYGQHFLADKRILGAIVDALGPTEADTVVEVGPGRGSLTDILIERSGRVIGVEIDRALAKQLGERYEGKPNVQVVQGDVLETDLHALAGSDFLLIGNVPYYITTPIVFKALEAPIPRRSVFLVQREVAERMAAKADTEAYGALSVNVAAVANVEQVMTVPAGAFQPPPKVESAVVRLTPRASPLVSLESLPAFRAFVQAAFGLRRKQMLRVLRTIRAMTPEDASALLERAGIDPAARPEVITPQGFASLFELFRGN